MGVTTSSIWVSGESTSCVLRQPLEAARTQTKGILEARTGKPVDIQE